MTFRPQSAILFGALFFAGCGSAQEAESAEATMQPFVVDASGEPRVATSLGDVDPNQERPVPTGKWEPTGVFAGKPISSTVEDDGVRVEELALGEGGAVVDRKTLNLLDWTIYTDDGIIVYSTTRPMRNDVPADMYGLIPEYLVLDRFVPRLAHPRIVDGILGMKAGGARRLRIPSEMAFGDRYYQSIPWNSTINVEIEVHDIITEPPAAEPKEVFLGTPVSSETFDNGLVVDVIREGEGKAAAKDDAVYIHLLGEQEDGRVFVNTAASFGLFSYRIGYGPFDTWLGPSLLGGKPGELRKVTVPPELAFADQPNNQDTHTWTLFIQYHDVRKAERAIPSAPAGKKAPAKKDTAEDDEASPAGGTAKAPGEGEPAADEPSGDEAPDANE